MKKQPLLRVFVVRCVVVGAAGVVVVRLDLTLCVVQLLSVFAVGCVVVCTLGVALRAMHSVVGGLLACGQH